MAHSNAVALHNRLFDPSCNPTMDEETKKIRSSRSSRRKTCFRTSAAEEEEMMENHIGLCQRVYGTCGSDVEMLIKDDEDPNSSKIIALASCQANISNLRVNLIEGPSST